MACLGSSGHCLTLSRGYQVAAVAHFGRIDVIVNNAGRGLLGAVEEASDAAVLILGSDAYGFTQAKLDTQVAELHAWREVSEGTDHDDQAQAA